MFDPSDKIFPNKLYLGQTPVSPHVRPGESACRQNVRTGHEAHGLTCGNVSAGDGAGDELFVLVPPGLQDRQQPADVELHVVVSLSYIRNITAGVVGPDISNNTT